METTEKEFKALCNVISAPYTANPTFAPLRLFFLAATPPEVQLAKKIYFSPTFRLEIMLKRTFPTLRGPNQTS